eukprot:jgi/Ulvmu1/7980/UM004_0213.1
MAYKRALLRGSILLHTNAACCSSAVSHVAQREVVAITSRASHTWTDTAHGTQQGSDKYRGIVTAGFLTGAGLGALLWGQSTTTSHAEAPPQSPKDSFPVIHRKEIEKHKTESTGIWVTYKDGVYDVTEFVSAHPGGNKILLAAGGPLEPFWAMYAQHKQKQVYDMLADMRIGSLPEDEQVTVDDNPYANDPARDDAIRVLSATPFNGEAPHAVLSRHITPNLHHFKRNHMPVPEALPDAYELQIINAEGDVAKTLTLDDLRGYPKHTVTVTLQCAGNRRAEMHAEREVKGLQWANAAVSTAQWSGARLSDVLRDIGAAPGPDAQHVQFVGLDCDMTGERYGASVPLEKALSDAGECVLAYEMNGEPIPRDHGYPVRAVVPGHVAARSVKWVEKVIVSSDESDSHWQQHDYKGFCPDEDWDHLDWSKAPAIQEMPVTSAILSPIPGSAVPAKGGKMAVSGYALAGGGRAIVRVDVSADGGKTWQPAKLLPVPEGMEQGYRKNWAWRHWEVEVEVPETGDVQLICKAVDDSYNVQPETFKPIYNARGVVANAWHRVAVKVV